MANRNRKGGARAGRTKSATAPQLLILIVLVCVLGFLVYSKQTFSPETGSQTLGGTDPAASTQPSAPAQTYGPATQAPEPEITPEPTPVLYDFEPRSVKETEPSNFIKEMAVQVDGELVESFAAGEGEVIDFTYPEDYTELEGVITFRGNNFRDGGAYGFANLTSKTFGESWNIGTGSLQAPDGEVWNGSGWVGQPLIVKWPKETRKIMNMYDWAKEKEELIEVIYATMDGNVYFMELESGSKTRDNLTLGFTFKGAGALDPRGYPILYLGSGYNSNRGQSRAFVVSLIDFSVMYEFGHNDSFAIRTWPMFDGSPLVDAETDQLIYPGENGILYIIRLNTKYNESAGTLSVEPERVVKWRYNASRGMWLGMESSPTIWRGHIFMCDNGGNLMCVNLNTLETVWVQDVLDDTNCTPVLELEDGHPYLYLSTSFHYGWRSYNKADIPVWKIDAVTGEIVWRTQGYDCHTVSGTSGGVQGTIAVGKNSLSDLIFVPIARYPSPSTGWLAAIDKKTGEEVWHVETNMYTWSSPVCIYDEDGTGYVIHCTTGGYIYLLDGLTGEKLDFKDLGSLIEASPAVYEDNVVIGTRNRGIYGIDMN